MMKNKVVDKKLQALAVLFCEKLMSDESLIKKDVAIPDGMETKIKNCINGIRRRRLRRARRVIAVILLCGFVAGYHVTDVEAVKRVLYDLLVQVNENHIELERSVQTRLNQNTVSELLPGWNNFYLIIPPDDFYVLLDECFTLRDYRVIVLQNADEDKIIFSQQSALMAEQQNDFEDATMIDISVSGEPGILVEKGNRTLITWSNGNLWYQIISYGETDKAELLDMAENLVYIKK